MRKIILATIIAVSSFSAIAQKNTVQIADDDHEKVFTSVQQMPEFPGGMSALMQFLSTNIVYPEVARKENIEGRVVLKFIIDENGKVNNVTVVRTIGGGCEAEAVCPTGSRAGWMESL